jgi:XTP/dITP diphosphohydrolase
LLDKIVLATKNTDKIREIKHVLAGLPFTILTFQDFYPPWSDVIEDGLTIADNALIKAQAVCSFTKLPALADDTGLEVVCLNGNPGVYSSRYAGEDATYADNCNKLLQEMHGCKDRKAVFMTVVALVMPDYKNFLTEGSVKGLITLESRGANGFGYDPVFLIPEFNKTFAEMSLTEKNQYSHRSIAFRKMKQLLLSLHKEDVDLS